MLRRSVLALTLVALAACDDTMPAAPDTRLAEAPAAAATGPAGEAHYRVTVYNLTTGQPFTPPLAAVHRTSLSLFRVGAPASHEIQQIAENGNLAPMLALAEESRHVADMAVTQGPTHPPVLPGEMVQFELEGRTGAKYLSVVSMLICTNDGFTGLQSVRLPKAVGESTTIDAYGYDAGTEINTEDWDDLVPPCAALTGFDAGEAGSGMSDPALAEGGVVHMHPGIDGSNDLDAAVHGWTGAVARFVVERIG